MNRVQNRFPGIKQIPPSVSVVAIRHHLFELYRGSDSPGNEQKGCGRVLKLNSVPMNEKIRCGWCSSHPIYLEYHDSEWGVPVHDDHKQFEFLVLESAQAGLSWLTILKRRDDYRRLYEDFSVEKVARFDAHRVDEMLRDPGIIRNRKKIESSINNAQRFLEIQEHFNSFSNYLWGFNEGKQVVHHFARNTDIPATSPLSDIISRDMKQRGFRFLGSTIIYAHLQATGMVNDHLVKCFRHTDCIE
jgi:DNA-3-methyladenine glycosylase I